MMAVVNHNIQSNLLLQCCILLNQQSGQAYAHKIDPYIYKIMETKTGILCTYSSLASYIASDAIASWFIAFMQ